MKFTKVSRPLLALLPSLAGFACSASMMPDGGMDARLDARRDARSDVTDTRADLTSDSPRRDGSVDVAEDAGPLPPPRPLAPRSLAELNGLRPTFRWRLAGDASGARLELCEDRACQRMIRGIDAPGETYTLDADLPPRRVVYWRLRARGGGVEGTAESATWYFVTGAASNARSIALRTRTDFNGDGLADVAVAGGVRVAAVEQPADIASGVYVYQGTMTGPATTPSTEISLRGDLVAALANAGDVNGDGYGDLIVGTSSARIYLGGPSGLDPMRRTLLIARGPSENFGQTVAGGGDVNDDGYADVLVGSQGENVAARNFAGAARVYPGSRDGTSTMAFPRLVSPAPTSGVAAGFGNSMAIVGDTNGDGFDDVVIMGGLEQGVTLPTGERVTRAGTTYLFAGNASGVAQVATATVLGEPRTQGGARVTRVGDVNGDGLADVLMSIPAFSLVQVFPGSSTSGILETPALRLLETAGDLTGQALAGIADINGDGLGDFAMLSFSAVPVENRLRIYFGGFEKPAPPPAQLIIAMAVSPARVSSFGSPGDLNGDGFDDLVVVVPGPSPRPGVDAGAPAGTVFIYFGTADAIGAEPAIRFDPPGAMSFGPEAAF